MRGRMIFGVTRAHQGPTSPAVTVRIALRSEELPVIHLSSPYCIDFDQSTEYSTSNVRLTLIWRGHATGSALIDHHSAPLSLSEPPLASEGCTRPAIVCLEPHLSFSSILNIFSPVMFSFPPSVSPLYPTEGIGQGVVGNISQRQRYCMLPSLMLVSSRVNLVLGQQFTYYIDPHPRR